MRGHHSVIGWTQMEIFHNHQFFFQTWWLPGETAMRFKLPKCQLKHNWVRKCIIVVGLLFRDRLLLGAAWYSYWSLLPNPFGFWRTRDHPLSWGMTGCLSWLTYFGDVPASGFFANLFGWRITTIPTTSSPKYGHVPAPFGNWISESYRCKRRRVPPPHGNTLTPKGKFDLLPRQHWRKASTLAPNKYNIFFWFFVSPEPLPDDSFRVGYDGPSLPQGIP